MPETRILLSIVESYIERLDSGAGKYAEKIHKAQPSFAQCVVYEERLRQLNLPSLEQRRKYLDIAFVYRLLTGQFKISTSSVGLRLVTNNRSHRAVTLMPLRTRNCRIASMFFFECQNCGMV